VRRSGMRGLIDKSGVGFTSLIQGQGHVIADAQPRRALNHPCLSLAQGRINA
jgi:hypothetical protein